MSATEGNATKGAILFTQLCSRCHTVDGTGDKDLSDLYGRDSSREVINSSTNEPGSEPVFWDDKTIDAYLQKPEKFRLYPGKKKKMGFDCVKNKEDRQALIAYLREEKDRRRG
ncbi:unnamed protein product [Rhizoctonia solani]|uniref:Cytochrome c n=1 Tax=Rhizoctonia solani TaxID=456999 RepID=A0A8H7HFL7_9AGAM|nr:Cytochrome c [Rhizoctonia solani]CAE6437324.1 unnamed protein product [Rhizoctonia solani]CAE6479195.1 unnamed protein product [Rhizoctonia solani]